MSIQLNFINQSNDTNNSNVVIFQKSASLPNDHIPVAWQVLASRPGEQHTLTIPQSHTVSVCDPQGNSSSHCDAAVGQCLQLTPTSNGTQLTPAGAASADDHIQVLNALSQGAINASIYKSGKLLASRAVPAGQTASFDVSPTLWFSVVPGATEGQLLSNRVLNGNAVAVDLSDLQSADLVMSGGGNQPFAFTLASTVPADAPETTEA